MIKVAKSIVWALFLGVVINLCGQVSIAQTQQNEQLRTDANAGTVRILAAGVDTAHMLHELASTLNKTGTLRILPILGDGGVQNVNDILYLRGIDMGLVRLDMLDLIRAQNTYGAIEKRIRYATKLFDEEIHLIARSNITSIAQLAGRRVNYGDPGSGTFERADRIFRALRIAAVPVSYTTAQAIEKVRSGEIAATMHVGPRPSPLIRQLGASDGVRLLSVPTIPGLKKLYKQTTFGHIDYPNLIPQGETRDTLSVETILAAYRWKKPNERSEKVDKFVRIFFDRLAEIQQPGRHPKWREVTLRSEVVGWRRLAVAQDWVRTRVAKLSIQREQPTAGVSKPLRRQFETFLANLRQDQLRQELQQAKPEPTGSSNEQLEKLFTNFLQWRKDQTR